MVIKKNRIRFHGLKRPKIRADMNKYTLYNLSRATRPPTASRTFFQQKWTAKSISRAYHGEYIREGLWTRMFQRRAPAVVPMDPAYLASQDGSAQAAGRGSGLEAAPVEDAEALGGRRRRSERRALKTPYNQMVYHPVERRLDFAVWRALFASSAKQARQMVVHGFVTVNGKKMSHPGYLLNPGDLFQADTTRVMTCMGQRKKYRDKFFANQIAHDSKRSNSKRSLNQTTDADSASPTTTSESTEPTAEEEDIDASLLAESTLATTEATALDSPTTATDDPTAAAKKTLKTLLTRTKSILDDPRAKKNMSGKLKIELRAYFKSLRTAMSKASSATPSLLEDLEAAFTGLAGRVASSSSSASAAPPSRPPPPTAEDARPDPEQETPEMQVALQAARDNPHDPSLPYATPWRPRDWMSAFAFIPRYLEVNQKVCAAVYLRHPVCYPGFAEVPTPFHPETGTLAHCWYLRRR